MAAAINRAMPSLTCLDTGEQAILTIVDATRTHGDGARRVVALSHANLILRSGEFVAVMGPSGSGKSTLLNLAGGLDTPSSGKVLVEGRDLASLNVARRAAIRRRSIGYVFQDFNLLPSLNAIENVSFPLELDGWPIRKARKAALEALQETGVAELALRRPEDMSGGQAQRVAIARALVGRRRLLLADEPTGALDSAAGTKVMEVLRSRADAGCAVLMVTHEPRFAAWADRTVFIRDGRITDETGATDFDELFTCDGEDDDDAGDARNSSQQNFRNNPGEQ
ncbi:ABC transporter ATP-binding protein [Bifidobacterium longum]|uniref:Macrolide export ATP-binding/permease protein MacB n=3 Tax=Bifidobacterium longum TaxID=216816 RepID=A0ABM9R2T6_BIFLI|nr:ABC transporter ATP-binding protein [Bifidobacterium longum]ACJ51672.1 ABC transporter related [Bifidobacterium longum subsp. infantis ATCC 15697 = JCM 1222 = DSM 20088]MBX4248589.1 ABC transporter ATP-binding protein [Bifidobacterium longum subsp. infantis]MEE4091131.1 ABC transporter ATP-binding protein [Bifidobacterium longum subsp. infantis]CEE96710.1 Macrolide export ATP-binding/permease protein MacB [Bifidobacterium longum subsp. infantis]CEE98397.1 Macrolide export ATP-binding/permea